MIVVRELVRFVVLLVVILDSVMYNGHRMSTSLRSGLPRTLPSFVENDLNDMAWLD